MPRLKVGVGYSAVGTLRRLRTVECSKAAQELGTPQRTNDKRLLQIVSCNFVEEDVIILFTLAMSRS